MIPESIERMAEAYASEYEPIFRKVVKAVYLDGRKELTDFVNLVIKARDAKNNFNELCQDNDQWAREEAGFAMTEAEDKVKAWLKRWESNGEDS